jgi:soluble P-type ATPase
MISVQIPGYGKLTLTHLVLDFNGTLAVDGEILPGVRERLERLGKDISIHVITADTFGTVRRKLEGIPCSVDILGKDRQDEAKRQFVETLGAETTAAIGNGRNDRLMLEKAALGIAMILSEGAYTGTLQAADLVFTQITDALDTLANPMRLTAGLRC